ncbi:MAG: GNAT family N-acetyltransferase [Proteobacteria bacterium]|nr:GNAT family N-acetyltransferase [Pseudomonadota bacterium]
MEIHHPQESDHPRIINVMTEWWKGRDLTSSLPRLFLMHFKSTSFIAEHENKLVGFLIGFFSADHETMGYIHFAGVHPTFQGQGLGKKLYHLFFEHCLKDNRSIVRSCTSPVNKESIAFHKRLGFHIMPSDHLMDDVPVHLDYSMPGDAKVLFKKILKKPQEGNISIQPADNKDFQTLSRLIRQSYQDVAQRFNLTIENCPKHPSNCSEEWIKKDFNRGVAYHILLKDGMPAGCAALEKADAKVSYLERLAVLPEFRHNGLGRQLVVHMLNQARQMDAKTISIGIIAEQKELKKWYEALGFSLVEIKNFDHLPFQVALMNIVL